MSLRLWIAVILAALGLGACAGAPAFEQRLLVKLAVPATDGTAIARHASEIAGVTARYVAPTSERWHAIALQCADQWQCEQAVARLRSDTTTYEQVDVDARRRVHSP
ncbi:MAG TPA: hypothetical protein VJ743_00285 [Albitalea sp.]|nr:hypothetical protein [Albitalea sp.]